MSFKPVYVAICDGCGFAFSNSITPFTDPDKDKQQLRDCGWVIAQDDKPGQELFYCIVCSAPCKPGD